MIEQHARSRCTNQSEANDELVGRREREREETLEHTASDLMIITVPMIAP